MNPTALVGGQELEEFVPGGDLYSHERRSSPAGGVGDDRESGPRAVPRVYTWAFPAAATLALVVVGGSLVLAPLALAISAMFAAGTASPAASLDGGRSRRSLSVVASIPAGFMLMVLTSLTLGLVGGAMDVPIWAHRGGAVVSTLVVVVGTGVLSWWRGGRVSVVGPDGPALAGATLLGALFCWVVTTQAFELWSRGMAVGTDFLRHLGMVRAVWNAGLLEPGATSYPRAFDAPVAWLSSALGLDSDARTLWTAAQPLALAMLVVMLFSVMAIASRATDLVIGGSWPSCRRIDRGRDRLRPDRLVQHVPPVRQRHEHDRGGRAARHAADRSGDQPRITDSCRCVRRGRSSQFQCVAAPRAGRGRWAACRGPPRSCAVAGAT